MHTESQNSSQKKDEPIQKIGWSWGREESWVVGVTLPLYAEYPPKVHFHKTKSKQNIIATLKEVPQIVFTYLLYLSTSKRPSGALQRGRVCKNHSSYYTKSTFPTIFKQPRNPRFTTDYEYSSTIATPMAFVCYHKQPVFL